MYRSTYNCRVFVKENSLISPLDIHTPKDKKPVFDDLVKEIQKQINLKNYSIIANNDDIIFDDRSFNNALNSASGDLSITLQRRLLLDNAEKESNLPESIPTSTRWSSLLLSSESQNSQKDNSTYRKDSGIFLDESLAKKEKVYLLNRHRKLPSPSSPALSNHYSINSYLTESNNIKTNPSASNSSLSSTSSCNSSESLPYDTIQYSSFFKLPAITTIADSNIQKLDIQLAPIHSHPVTASKKSKNLVNVPTNFHRCNFKGGIGKVCGQTFKRSYDLTRHKNIHLENRHFSYCDVCGKKFTRRDALRRHERVQGHNSKSGRLNKKHNEV